MTLIAPSRTSTTLARGNACAFVLSFLWVLSGMTAASKSPTSIVAMCIGSLIFAWMFVATLIAHLTSGDKLVCECPTLLNEVHAQTRFPVVFRVENQSNRWPRLFLTAVLITSIDGEFLRSPPKFLGILPKRGAGQFQWYMTARKRGDYLIHGLEAGSTFPGSLLSRQYFFAFDLALLAVPTKYRLHPRVEQLLKGQQRSSGHQPYNPSAMEEFVGVREYRAGDNPRNVSMTLSVRMPDFPWQLVVREFEDPKCDQVCVLLDTAVSEYGSPDYLVMLYRLEKSISFAVALCRQLCEQKRTVRFLACHREGQVLDLIIRQPFKDIPRLERRLARIRPVLDKSLALNLLNHQSRVSDSALLFVSLREGDRRISTRSGYALRLTPEWQASLVEEVHAA